MRRPFLSFLLLAFGALPVVWGTSAAAAASGPASAQCGQDFAELVSCSTYSGEPVTVTLKTSLDYGKPDGKAEKAVLPRRDALMVQVPSGVHTGEGGTVLLLLAGNRFVSDEAEIQLLSAATVDQLTNDGICGTKNIDCKPFTATANQTTVKGADLVRNGVAEALDRQTITVPSAAPTSRPAPTRTASGKTGGNTGAKADDGGGSSTSGILISVIALLVIVLGVLAFLIRRSGGALPHAFAAAGFGGTSAPSHTATTAAAPALGGGDEPTTVVRPRPKEPPRSPGRAVGPRRGQFRTAVVRTELHPQGYVEVERVLYRAVWADPSQPPPPPGGVIDLTEPHDPDDDVFYAFPSEQQPATGAR
ncbi:hypothetical protein [Streptomyces diastatochromogenes]|uniref:hypothetical protein n=1 Tax=Streptomyces diastatochromogenes TaxID=42236 RepID=UPI003688046B